MAAMIYRPAASEGAAHYSSTLAGHTNRLSSEATRARDLAIGMMLEKRDAINEGITAFGEANKRRQAERAAKHGGKGGAIGTGLGAVGGAILAPFTFGASLALPAAIGAGAALGGGLGGAVGGAIDPPAGGGDGGAGVQRGLNQSAALLSALYTPNPFYAGNATAAGQTGNGAGYGGAPVQSTQFR